MYSAFFLVLGIFLRFQAFLKRCDDVFVTSLIHSQSRDSDGTCRGQQVADWVTDAYTRTTLKLVDAVASWKANIAIGREVQ